MITIPSTGGGVALSDDDPVSVGISSNDPGSATDAARRDHRHQVGRASATQFGVSTYATDAEALAGTSTTHAINPVSLAHVLANSGGGTADGVVTGGSVSGTSLTLERSVGADVVITGLPSGGGGTGDTTPVVYLARTAADTTNGVQELTLTTALEDGYLLAFDLDIGTGDTLAGRVLVPSSLLRTLAAQATGPSADDIDDGYTETCPRLNLTSSLSHATSNVTIWYKDDTHLWFLDSRQEAEGIAITGYPMAGGAAGGGGTDTNDYVDALTTAVSGTTLTVTLGRTGSLVDLTSNVTLPSTGGGFSLQQIQDAMVSFFNFGNNITDTYDDPNNVYNINSADNYVNHLGATVASDELTITLGRTGSLADIQQTVTLPTGGGGTVSNEHIRDTIAAFTKAGDGISIIHYDALNELVFSARSLDAPYKAIVALSSTGHVHIVDRFTPANSILQDGQIPDALHISSAIFYEGQMYAVEGRDLISVNIDSPANSTRESNVFPSTMTQLNGLVDTGNGILGFATNRFVWDIDIDNPGNSTQRSDEFVLTVNGVWGGYTIGGQVYLIVNDNNRGAVLLEFNDTDAALSVFIDDFPTPTGNRGGVLIGNVAYVANTFGVDSLWALSNPIDPTSAVKIGNFPTAQNVVLMAEVELRLNTNVVAEGSQNLYYTNARADARIALKVANFALKVNSGTLVPTSKLPFTFNPTGAATESLDTLTYDGTIYGVRNIFDVISLSDRPVPAALTRGQGYFVNATGKLYIGIDDPHTSAAPDGDFAAQTTRTDLHFVNHLPSLLNNLTIGDFWFQRTIQEFYKLVQRAGVRNLEQVHAQAGLAGNQTNTAREVVFLGLVATDQAALRFTNAIFTGKDYFYIDSDTDEVKLLDNSSFTAPGQTAHHYQYAEVGGGGGSGTDTNDYADSAALAVSSGDLTLTLGRTGSLADLTASVTLPAGGGTSDTKVVTALPNGADVADADKGKLWIVQSMADGGTEEVAHFSPTAAAVLEFTAQSYIEGTETVVGFNAHHGHAVPNDTNIESFYWDTVDNNTQLYFTAARTPFDFHSYPQLAIYLRRVFEDGDWQRLWMEETSGNSGVYNTQGAQTLQSIVPGNDYHLIIRHVSSQVLNQAVATVPSTNRLEMFPNGGRFRAFADLDSISHLSVVTEVNRVVDGEVDSVALALAGQDLTVTVGRSVGVDLTATATLPGSLEDGGTITGAQPPERNGACTHCSEARYRKSPRHPNGHAE